MAHSRLSAAPGVLISSGSTRRWTSINRATPSPANFPGPAPDALPDERKEPASPVPVRTERRVDTTQRPEAQAQTPKSHPEALQEPEARLPHERDEATDMTGGIPSREVRQAYEDVTRGLTDTDKGPPMHRAYQQQKK